MAVKDYESAALSIECQRSRKSVGIWTAAGLGDEGCLVEVS
jgi:hypothetical protein